MHSSSLDMGMFQEEATFFIIIEKKINESSSQMMMGTGQKQGFDLRVRS